jgi:hypothetical protein
VRVAFYWLIVKNLFAMMGTSIRRLGGSLGRRFSWLERSNRARRHNLQVADVERRRHLILLKNAPQTVLHRMVSRMPFN